MPIILFLAAVFTLAATPAHADPISLTIAGINALLSTSLTAGTVLGTIGTVSITVGQVVGTANVSDVTEDEVLGMIILGKCPPGAIPGPGAIS